MLHMERRVWQGLGVKVRVVLWGGGWLGGGHEHTLPSTRPCCSLRVKPVGIRFIVRQICFVAALEKKATNEHFDICDAQSI